MNFLHLSSYFTLLVFYFGSVVAVDDNINGAYQVKQGFHYSNKTSITWGENSEKSFSVLISMSDEFATYDCTNTTSYSCEDPAWIYDWNKLWGKSRCGYAHGHHQDSDRFVWRRCSDSSCSLYDGKNKISLAAYSYDAGVAPYTGENPGLLQEFKTTIYANTQYKYTLAMDETGLSTFILSSVDGTELETQYVQHTVLCVDNYFEGTVQGLYFGGTCAAPITVIAKYES